MKKAADDSGAVTPSGMGSVAADRAVSTAPAPSETVTAEGVDCCTDLACTDAEHYTTDHHSE